MDATLEKTIHVSAASATVPLIINPIGPKKSRPTLYMFQYIFDSAKPPSFWNAHMRTKVWTAE